MLATKYKVWTGGNIGGSLLFDLPRIADERFGRARAEQLHAGASASLQWSPHVAVVNMISVDHTDWHGDVENYIDAKRNIVRFQKPDDIAVLSDENDESGELRHGHEGANRDIWHRRSPAVCADDPGRHNQLNAQAAFAAANVLGVSWDERKSR